MKNKRTLIIIGIIAILAVFIFVQVVEITNEKTDYQWEWWVVLAAFILLEALVVLIIFLANRQNYKKCLTSRYLDDNGRAYLAVANFELENYDKFLEEIDKIRHEDIVSKKYFWLWVCNLKLSQTEQPTTISSVCKTVKIARIKKKPYEY